MPIKTCIYSDLSQDTVCSLMGQDTLDSCLKNSKNQQILKMNLGQ